jgi:hypothetical protein
MAQGSVHPIVISTRPPPPIPPSERKRQRPQAMHEQTDLVEMIDLTVDIPNNSDAMQQSRPERYIAVSAALDGHQSGGNNSGQFVSARNRLQTVNKQPLKSPNHANAARTASIKQEQSRVRASIGPHAGDGPPARLIDHSEPFLEPLKGDDSIKFNVQFWTYEYLLDKNNHKKGLSLRKEGRKSYPPYYSTEIDKHSALPCIFAQ